jgi:GNAT superfamily N-acetyltransferase
MKTISVRTLYLEMLQPPEQTGGPPTGGVEIVRLRRPPVPFYRFLYDAVGRDWNWVDRKLLSDDQLEAIIHDDLVEIYVLYLDGMPAGFCELDRRTEHQIELAYFGLMPRFLGKGLGKYFLHWIVHRAWSYKPGRVWLHTCALDHPAALPTYLEAGFVIFDEKVVDQVVPDATQSDRTQSDANG